jgi:hypothetical protein
LSSEHLTASPLTEYIQAFVHLFNDVTLTAGYAVAQLVEALRYKPEGRGFDFRLCLWNFLLT